MKWIFLVLGLITVMEIVSKIINCASCNRSYLGIEMSGYVYLAVQFLFAGILLNSAYRQWNKPK